MRGRCNDFALACRGVGDSAIWRSNCLGCLLHDLTCIRRSARQPIVPPNRRRATSRRGQMETYYMNLSPGTNPGGLIRLRIIIEVMWPVAHSCNAMHDVCGTQRARSVLAHAYWTACVHSRMTDVCCIQHASVQLELFRRAGGCQNLTRTIFRRPRMCSVNSPDNQVTIVFRLVLSGPRVRIPGQRNLETLRTMQRPELLNSRNTEHHTSNSPDILKY